MFIWCPYVLKSICAMQIFLTLVNAVLLMYARVLYVDNVYSLNELELVQSIFKKSGGGSV